MGNDKNLFFGANTADGFVGFYNQIVDVYDLTKFYILKGGSGIGKSTFIRKFADAFKEYNRDFLICSGDPNSLDGVIIPALKIGIIDGTSPHVVDPKYPGVADEIVNLGEFIDFGKVTASKQVLKTLYQKKGAHYAKAFAHLSAARRVHHQIESHYARAIDFDKVNLKLAKIIMQHVDD